MKTKHLNIIGLSVALSGCMGIVTEKELSQKAQPASDHRYKVISNYQLHDMHGKNGPSNERSVASMMDWIKISTD